MILVCRGFELFVENPKLFVQGFQILSRALGFGGACFGKLTLRCAREVAHLDTFRSNPAKRGLLYDPLSCGKYRFTSVGSKIQKRTDRRRELRLGMVLSTGIIIPNPELRNAIQWAGERIV